MPLTEKLSISMTSEMSNDLRATVEAGEFSSTSEAVRDAVRLWQRQRLEDAERLAVLRARIRSSIDDPSPNLTSGDVKAQIATLFERAQQVERDAAAKS